MSITRMVRKLHIYGLPGPREPYTTGNIIEHPDIIAQQLLTIWFKFCWDIAPLGGGGGGPGVGATGVVAPIDC